MSQVTYGFFLAFLVLTVLTNFRSESLDEPLPFFPAAVGETEAVPPDVEPVSGRAAWHLSLGRATSRWKGMSALTAVPLRSLRTRDTSLGVLPYPSSLAGAAQTMPLYQSLQVFRC
jgi:hypothetical protein